MTAPARVRRAEAQAQIAAEADRIRYTLGVDQADLAAAIGTGPTHVQHLLARREAHTVTLADVVLAAESGSPGAAQWAEDLVGYLATRLGCRLVAAADPTGEVVLHAAEAAAHAGAAVQGAVQASADGVVDEREATALREGPVRQALAAVQRLDAGLAVKQRRLRAVGR